MSNITKKFVDNLELPSKIRDGRTEQKRYYDDKLKGFGIRTTSGGTKAFFVEKIIHKKQKRITIGHYPELTVEMARKEAHKILGKIAIGIDPIAEKKETRSKAITLKQAFEDYLRARKVLKPITVLDYQRVLNQVVPDWLNKKLLSISKDMVAKRHEQYGQTRSQAKANLAMRVLRAIFNFAMGEYENAKGQSLILENPVKRLSHSRAWYRIERRQSIIKAHDLPAWYQGIMRLEPDMLKDYFLLILFTGLRRQEAASLRWNQIDLQDKTMTIIDTKNHERHTLPLSDYLFELLNRRKQSAINEYVFPAESKAGHLADPRKAMLRVIEKSGVNFTVHDLRRTFITIAESLDIPVYALKKLLNHKMSSDVTAGYVVIDVERLRKPMQMITDYLLKSMNVSNNGGIYD